MRARANAFVPTLIAVVATAALAVATVAARQAQTAPSTVTVHEWGTFTSVAGQDGHAVEWAPFSGPLDLPCFVSELNPFSVKVISDFGTFTPVNNDDPGLNPGTASSVPLNGWLPSLRATERMETPVLYFYSPVDATVDVGVRFPHGLVTEWYPTATVPPVSPWVNLAQTVGTASWRAVTILPHAQGTFPSDFVKSHYYAARETDAAPVRVAGQLEKFLFYRGLASFPSPVSVKLDASGLIELRNSGAPLPNAVVFESDGRRMGYRVLGRIGDQQILSRPPLTMNLEADAAALRQDLQAMLVGQGLYPREAAAMVETWRDSWFEPGVRVFYLLPRASVDQILPLSISPAPKDVARVFVGRVELVTPAMEAEVSQAIRANDVATLMRYGRFLEPIANRVLPQMSVRDQMQAVTTLRTVAARFTAAATICR